MSENLTYWHRNFAEVFSNAILHDTPQIQWVIGFVWYSGSSSFLRLHIAIFIGGADCNTSRIILQQTY